MDDEYDESLVEIDEHRLDYECSTQSKKYMRWALRLVDKQANLDEAEAQLDLTEVLIAREVRTNPKAFGLERVTDKAIDHAVKGDPRYQKWQTKVIARKRAAGRVKAVVTALDHRKKMIESMVFLRGQMYFADPRPDKNALRVFREGEAVRGHVLPAKKKSPKPTRR